MKLASTTLLLLTLLAQATPTYAQVYESRIWKALPGKNEQMLAAAKELQAEHTKLGAQVLITMDMMNQMHYTMIFENNVANNDFYEKANTSKAVAKIWAKINKNPSGELQSHTMTQSVAVGDPGTVFEKYIWEALPGKGGVMFEKGIQAKAIHDAHGTSVSIAADKLNRMHYVMSFKDWASYAKFMDTPNPKFDAFMQESAKNPSGRMVEVQTSSTR